MTHTAFQNLRVFAAGLLSEVAPAVLAAPHGPPILVFEDATGRIVDLDPRETYAEPARGRGRPRLGVTAREVTLLPRHWDWLAAQPGGASATLRRMIDDARRSDAGQARERRDAAYRFMSAIAGDLPHFEAASRALFAGDLAGFAEQMAAWPPDVRDHALKLLGPVE